MNKHCMVTCKVFSFCFTRIRNSELCLFFFVLNGNPRWLTLQNKV